MKKIRKIKVWQYAKFQSVVMALVGVVAGMLYALIGAIYDATTGNLSHGTALAFLAIPIMPFYFAAFGLVSALIGAILFNRFAKWIRFKNIDFEQ